jgi:hypothetical protein
MKELKEKYCLSLTPSVVNETIENIKDTGGKLSPLVESKLKEFNKQWKNQKN